MPQVWDADRESIDKHRAKILIERQFSELAPVTVETFGAGWDNVAYLINGEFVFRFPRRKIAVRLLENEIRALRLIVPRVPARVPDPEFVGEPIEGAPPLFVGYRRIPGITACRATLTDEDRSKLAVPLAHFLSELHNIPVSDAIRAGVPADELGRSDIITRRSRVVDNLRIAAPLVPHIDAERHRLAIEHLAQTPLALPSDLRLLHGDLYARHIVLDNTHSLAGIIDWGDVHIGDPALDFSIAFSFLPTGARDAFRSAYGTIDDAAWDRARFRAIHYGTIFTIYGAEIGDDAIRRAGTYALASALD